MNKTLLCLTAAISFSLLNVATADPMTDCDRLLKNRQGIEAFPFCREACNLNDGSGCSNLGFNYENGLGVRHDYKKAKTYYEKVCSKNFGVGCISIGKLYAEGKGVRQNFQTAKEYFGMACDLGDQDGCDEYRELNEKGY